MICAYFAAMPRYYDADRPKDRLPQITQLHRENDGRR
jgi:hypothetical protein